MQYRQLATLFIFGILLLGLTGCTKSENEETPGVDLNQKIGDIRKDMSKAEVIGILGTPTWVGLPSDRSDYGVKDADTAFILYWRNPGFPVVQAHFDANQKVRWDTGWSGKETYTHVFEPKDGFLCSNPERVGYCDPAK